MVKNLSCELLLWSVKKEPEKHEKWSNKGGEEKKNSRRNTEKSNLLFQNSRRHQL